jgi:hypothetical protein
MAGGQAMSEPCIVGAWLREQNPEREDVEGHPPAWWLNQITCSGPRV